MQEQERQRGSCRRNRWGNGRRTRMISRGARRGGKGVRQIGLRVRVSQRVRMDGWDDTVGMRALRNGCSIKILCRIACLRFLKSAFSSPTIASQYPRHHHQQNVVCLWLWRCSPRTRTFQPLVHKVICQFLLLSRAPRKIFLSRKAKAWHK